jgi:hypothetical protein
MTRPLRDILAEAMRRERLGFSPPAWADAGEDMKEEWRRRADRLLRIAEQIAEGPLPPLKAPADGVIVSTQLPDDPGKERAVRRADGAWEVVLVDRKTGEVSVEQTFTLTDVHLLGGDVQAGRPEVAKRKGLGRLLAAALDIYRLDAAQMEAKE